MFNKATVVAPADFEEGFAVLHRSTSLNGSDLMAASCEDVQVDQI
jgi:hypothetical protein